MIDVIVHFRGVGSDRRRLQTVPVVGTYIIGPGAERRLWGVSAVVVDGDEINVYAVQVSPRLAGELTAAWATWGETTEA
jgi:hypothetical protein